MDFRYEEPFQRFSFVVWAKAVETAAWVAQRLVITGLKPRCELKGQTASVPRNRVTFEETEQEIREAIDLYLRGMREDGLRIPEPGSSVDYVEIAA